MFGSTVLHVRLEIKSIVPAGYSHAHTGMLNCWYTWVELITISIVTSKILTAPPQTPSWWGAGHPLPTPLPCGLRPLAVTAHPPFQKSWIHLCTLVSDFEVACSEYEQVSLSYTWQDDDSSFIKILLGHSNLKAKYRTQKINPEFPFNAFALLVGRQQGNPACKSWVLICWWRQFDWSFARVLPPLPSSLASIKPANPSSPGKRPFRTEEREKIKQQLTLSWGQLPIPQNC